MALLIWNVANIKTREYNADEYVSLIGTHANDITLGSSLNGLHKESGEVIHSFGNKIVLYDNITMYLATKP